VSEFVNSIYLNPWSRESYWGKR